jgi:PfaB family protein
MMVSASNAVQWQAAPLALVGIETLWAGCDGLEAFERCMVAALVPDNDLPGQPPDPAACENLLARAALGALRRAGLEMQNQSENIAVLYACDLPVFPRWEWAAHSLDFSGAANPAAAMLQEAARLLANGQARAVVTTAACGLPALAERAPGFGFDRSLHGWRVGTGGGALVWTLPDVAQAASLQVYALVDGLAGPAAGFPRSTGEARLPGAPSLDLVRSACQEVLARVGGLPERVGYVEAFASGVDALDGIEISGMIQAYRAPNADLHTALGSAQAQTGYLGAAAGLASLSQAALCVYHRVFPGAPGWSAPKLPALWRGAPFFVPADSRPWFQPRGSARLAAVNLPGRDGAFSQVLLREALDVGAGGNAPGVVDVHPNAALAEGDGYLFPLTGAGMADLQKALDDIQRQVLFADSLGAVSAALCQEAAGQAGAPFALAVVGRTPEEIIREVALAQKALPGAFSSGSEWQTPLGSTFTARPVGREGEVALVYPGAFSAYPGVGKDLFWLFPALHAHMEQISADVGQVLRERLLYPRSLAAASTADTAALESALLADPVAMLVSGSALAVLYTRVLRECLGIRPAAAFGYSLGETAMLYASGVWGQGDAAAARLADSPVFRERLAGPRQAIREFWGGSNGASVDVPQWANFLLMAAPEKVQRALEAEKNVYLTHINTPRQVVIGGDPLACRRVAEAIGCASLQAPFDYALHCLPMRSEFDALAYLHDWPVDGDPGLRLYTAANDAPLPLQQEHIATSLAHMLTSPLDFPRLVRRVYQDGARIFLEAGAGSNCARWIDESLNGLPHLALSMNRRGSDDRSTLVRVLARLHSHRVPVRLQIFSEAASMQKVNQ